MREKLLHLLDHAVERVRDLYKREPARVNAAVASAIVAGSLSLGLVLDAAVVSTVVGTLLALLLTGEGTRSAVVSPATAEMLADAPDIPDDEHLDLVEQGGNVGGALPPEEWEVTEENSQYVGGERSGS